ncbi:MAG: PD-(D/E)XK nuclease family transposase [Peptococcaceae bacterium]|nr:PD-(D/E)XK nuclease family transposase [Peptococcaceae bacterium]
MEFHYDDYYRPSHDVVFAITFAKKELFIKLCSAVYGQEITIVGEPHSQAVVRENDVLLNSIRFDVLGIADTDQIFTLDIQRRYSKGRQERRGAYYMCRAVSSQRVSEMKYEDLYPVHIAFVLTDPNRILDSKNTSKSIRKVGLCYLDTGELYDDLIELVLVYVPAVIKETTATEGNNLYIFSRFFAVSSQEEAAAYAAEFGTNDLAKELVHVYNSLVANYQGLQDVENSVYFTQRLNEAQLAQARAEAEARGEARGKAEGASQLARLINDGYDVDTALKMIKEGS